MAVAALVLWALTAGAGIYLLFAGNAARRSAGSPVPAGSATASSVAVQITDASNLPPIPRPKVTAPAGQHPLLEFSHPALGLAGLSFWFLFVYSGIRPLAWISLGILLVTVGAGLTWLTGQVRAARSRGEAASGGFPPRLIVTHGLAAAVTLTLVVLTALSASHG